MSDAISATISGNVRDTRVVKGISRDDLAAAARAAGAPDQFTTAALRNLETGRRAVTVDETLWLSSALGVPIPQLLAEHAELFGTIIPPGGGGQVEAATRKAIDGLADIDGRSLALAEGAYALARKLDDDAGMAAAAVLKELRATLTEIWAAAGVDDEDEDDLGPS